MSEYYIKVNNLNKTLGNENILDDISLNIQKGTIVGFIGKNGSGKTMLFRAISGLITPDSGEIFIDDKQLGIDISFPPSLGLIIENIGLWNYMSGFECLKTLAEIQNKITDSQIKEAITRVGLDPNNRKKVGKYSLGMRQRLMIAQAIMEHPELLVLDEPTNGLDESGVELLNNILFEERKNGTTILIASHDRTEINFMCDNIYTIHAGKVCEDE